MTRSRASGFCCFSCSMRRPISFTSSRLRARARRRVIFVLCFNEVGAGRLEAVGPNMRGAFRIDQLDIDPNLVARPTHAAFEDITDAEIAADLLHVSRLALV